MTISPFRDKVHTLIRMVPFGSVASYGQIALYAGLPRAAREVGWILNASEGRVDLPWWRIVNNKGVISIDGTKFNDKLTQKKLLMSEGIPVSDDLTLPIEEYRWRMPVEEIEKLQLEPAYIRKIIEKYTL